MAELRHVEVWTDVQAAGGRRRGVLSDLLECNETVSLNGEHTVNLLVPYDDPAAVTMDTPGGETNFDGGRVLRLNRSDGTWTEHRINAPTRNRDENTNLTRRIVAHSIMSDLAQRGIVTRAMTAGQPTLGRPFDRLPSFEMLGLTAMEHWDQFINPALVRSGQTFWHLSVIASSTIAGRPLDIVYDQDTPLSALHKLATALGGMEIHVLGSPTTYTVIVRHKVGAGVAPIVVQARRNLRSVGVTDDHTDQANRILALGPQVDGRRATMQDAEWRLGELVSLTLIDAGTGLWHMEVELRDEAGGPGPIAFADQWKTQGSDTNGLLWMTLVDPTGAGTDPYFAGIVATDPIAQTVTLQVFAGAGGDATWLPTITPNHRVKILRWMPDTQIWEPPLYADHPTSVARYGVRIGTVERGDVPATNNLIRNALMRQWETGARAPVGWDTTTLSVTPEREEDEGDWVTGGVAMRCRITSPTQRVVSPPALLPVIAHGHVSFLARVKTIKGRIRVRLRFRGVAVDQSGARTPTGFEVYLTDAAAQPDLILPAVANTALNVWQDLGVAAIWNFDDPRVTLTSGELYVEVWSLDESTPVQDNEFILDAVQLTNTADQRPLLDGNAGVRLWQAANERLAIYAEPASILNANLLDLATIDASKYPFDAFVLGAEVRVVDAELAVDHLTRITGWSRDWLHRINTSLQVSTERPSLTKVLTIRPPTARFGG